MATTVWIQILVMLVLTAVFWYIGGQAAGVSALLGSLCYVLPTIVTVLILSVLKSFPQFAGVGFMLGEGLKIVLALMLLVSVFYFYHQDILFVPFLLGLLAVSHFVFLISWKVQRHGK